jgi:hypothetical protein
MRATTRKFGLLWTQGEGPTGWDRLPGLVKERCGMDMLAAELPVPGIDDTRAPAAIARFRAAGVTTVVIATDPISPAVFLNTADSQGYFPEWFVSGFWELDSNTGGTVYSSTQWQNAFGITAREFRGLSGELDYYRAYKSIDPAGTPDGVGDSVFYPLLQIANGIQGAGPNLTPDTFAGALERVPPREPIPNRWMCCGYAGGNYSYAQMITEIYWDDDIPNPASSNIPGRYIFPTCGERWAEGQIPEGEPVMFQGGCSMPDDGRAAPPANRT